MLKRWLEKRRVVLILGTGAIAALVALSVGLSSLEFESPGPYPLWELPPFPKSQQPPGSLTDLDWVAKLLLYLLAFLIGVFIVSLFDPKIRKWLLQRLPFWITIIVLLMLVLARTEQLARISMVTGAATPIGYEGTLPPPASVAEYQPPQISPAVAFAATVIVLLIGAGIAYFIWRNRPRRASQPVELEELGQIVQSALDDLDAGRDWEETIIQCYVRMSETVNTERGLQRQQAMTPSEFADRLVRAGLPASAVQRLTHLFEAVRYGAHSSTRAEVDEAVACLRVIVTACEGAV